MTFNPHVFDIWVFRRTPAGVEYLLLHTSTTKADRHFGGGRVWQVPSEAFALGETAVVALDRVLARFGLRARGTWAAEHVYTIYNRCFEEVPVISVFTAEGDPGGAPVTLDPEEHAEHTWLPYEEEMNRVHDRGLKAGLRSTQEYVTGVAAPAAELRLR